MIAQTQLDFTVHSHEDNAVSQTYLEAGRKQFSKNCKILYDAFLRGEIINTLNSPVPEFRRRRQDLTDNNGIKIELHPSTNGRLKQWYLKKV